MADPLVLLEQLFAKGLEHVQIEVPEREGSDRLVKISDKSLEKALKISVSEKPQETETDPRERDAIKASMLVVLIDGPAAVDIGRRAMAGEERAQRIYQALILRELVKSRMNARKLILGLFEGDQKAHATYTRIKYNASIPGPLQFKARCFVFLIKDAYRELERVGREAQKVEAEAAKNPPAQEKATA